ncbi:DUF1571 domain-containing protein [Planctomicrobium sp. SH661]|uniref:DUF1571 domain-containing protein n=1 Tax=Planctomicrobium sp. SH661 TaxID=3448124 RepID=UPI003F5C5135
MNMIRQPWGASWATLGLFALLLAGGVGQSASGQEEGSSQPQEHPLIPAMHLVKQSYAVVQQLNDYEATVIKQELINGQLISQRMRMRTKEKPFSIYLFYEEPHAGREVLFVMGQNDNQLLVHEATGLTSLVGTVSLAVDSPQVMAENRHLITDMGMRRMLELLLTQWEIESKYGECDVKFYPAAKMGNAECEVIESSHPRPRKQFPFHMTRIFLEKQSRLPIRIENYGFPQQPNQPAPLVEEYTYVNVKTNLGLTAADFDRRNQKYSFR